MTEQPKRITASEIVDDLLAHPLSPAEARPITGPLRLRADIPAVKVDEDTPEVLSQLNRHDLFALVEPEKGAVAVVMPVEQYLAFVSSAMENAQKPGWRVDRQQLHYFYVEEVTDSPADAPAEPPR